MAYLEATVDAVVVKPLPEPDKYKNTHRRSIKIGDDWYSCGSGKSDRFNVKTSDGFVELTEGSLVEFIYDVNGDWKNVQMKTLNIKATGEAPKPKQQQQAQAPTTQTAGNVPKNNNYVNPAEIGQAMNLAVNSLGYREGDMLDPVKAIEAIQWYKRSRQLFTSLFPTVDTEEQLPEQPKPKAKAKPKAKTPPPPQDVEDDYEEDEI